MTDLQVKAAQVALDREKLAETKRANRMKETQADAENLAKYGYTKYQPASGDDRIWWTRSNAQGFLNMLGEGLDYISDKIPFMSLIKMLSSL